MYRRITAIGRPRSFQRSSLGTTATYPITASDARVIFQPDEPTGHTLEGVHEGGDSDLRRVIHQVHVHQKDAVARVPKLVSSFHGPTVLWAHARLASFQGCASCSPSGATVRKRRGFGMRRRTRCSRRCKTWSEPTRTSLPSARGFRSSKNAASATVSAIPTPSSSNSIGSMAASFFRNLAGCGCACRARNPGQNVRAKAGLNKSILDQGWFEFRRQLQYKLQWAGGMLIAVPPQQTSQQCPLCGRVSAANRPTQARFWCVECLLEDNADVIGAKNVLARGHRVVACGEAVSRCVSSAASSKQEPAEATEREATHV